jgi:2-succinyl-6-hydroxy-2,4-cyclohexadiene-1-carboxylate synthase
VKQNSANKILLNYEFTANHGKPVLVFLHGFMGDLNEFRAISDEFKSQYSTLLIDLPGHGRTRVTGSAEFYSVPNAAESIVSLLNELGIDKCVLIGYSMGGRYALYTALNYPEYFEKIVLESSSPGLKTEKERQLRIENDSELTKKLRDQKYSDFLENWYNQPLFRSLKSNKIFDLLMKSRLNNDPSGLIKSLEYAGTGAQPAQWENWTKNKIPTLLICGEKDVKFKKIADDMVRMNNYAEKIIVSTAGHNVHAEKEEEYKTILKNYIMK